MKRFIKELKLYRLHVIIMALITKFSKNLESTMQFPQYSLKISETRIIDTKNEIFRKEKYVAKISRVRGNAIRRLATFEHFPVGTILKFTCNIRFTFFPRIAYRIPIFPHIIFAQYSNNNNEKTIPKSLLSYTFQRTIRVFRRFRQYLRSGRRVYKHAV